MPERLKKGAREAYNLTDSAIDSTLKVKDVLKIDMVKKTVANIKDTTIDTASNIKDTTKDTAMNIKEKFE